MKETVSANIGSVAFTLDKDACRLLSRYLDDIRRRLPADDTETMADIEARVAEIFRERVSSPMRVITIDVVRATMDQLGAPADFGEPRNPDSGAQRDTREDEETQPAVRKLRRSRSDRSIAGICGGLGAFFQTDTTMIRLIMLLLILFGGVSIWVYIILWIVIPEEPQFPFNPFGSTCKKP